VKVVVMGAGVAGLSTALALARSDHEVVVLERDAAHPPDDPSRAPEWERLGVPHFLQPHAFLGRGIKELRHHAPDVYQALLDAGAEELRLFDKMPGSPLVDEDKDLLFLGCRRPVIEWVMRRVVSAEPNVEIRAGVAATGLRWDQDDTGAPRGSGVTTAQGVVPADLIVDAMGRSSPLSDWIEDASGGRPETRSDDCGIVYYSRYFRFHPGQSRPEGPWLLGPRSELGYMETGTFWGDKGTFALVQQIRANDRELRVLRHAEQFMASLRSQPAVAALIEEDVSEPITPVLPMGQLRNTFKEFVKQDRPVISGVIAIGDARCHTNPRYAWGLSLALAEGFLLADLVAEHGRDAEALTVAFESGANAWASTAFRSSSATDNERKLYWSGAPIDFTTPAGALQLFLLMTFPVAGMKDAEIFRKAVRRIMLLDDPRTVESDHELLGRAETIARALLAGSPPRQGPARTELLQILQAPTGNR
jgi:2-polyprenyl-6-methoxyphenol hydroxylase-like FAD-dependent oxidoreductase